VNFFVLFDHRRFCDFHQPEIVSSIP